MIVTALDKIGMIVTPRLNRKVIETRVRGLEALGPSGGRPAAGSADREKNLSAEIFEDEITRWNTI